MSGPRQVARIWHKTRRLRSRAGYGAPGLRRGRFSADVGPEPLAPVHRCEGKRPHDGLVAAINASRATPGTVPYRCDGCRKWHIGHPPRSTS